MKLFKERFISALKAIGTTLIGIVVAFIILVLLGATCYGLDHLYPHLSDYLFFGAIGCVVLYYVLKGLYWMFIDPFVQSRKEKKAAKAAHPVCQFDCADDDDTCECRKDYE